MPDPTFSVNPVTERARKELHREASAMEFEDVKHLVKEMVGEMRLSQTSLVRDIMGEMLKSHQTDHDTLVRMETLITGIQGSLISLQQTDVRRVDATETRLRELENTRWKLAGGLGIATLLFSGVFAFVTQYLVGHLK